MRREAALRAGRDRGFALLIVLWTLGLLSLIATQILASGRSETQLAANIRSNALAEAAADGAVNQSVLRLMQGAWRPDGTPHVLRIAAAVVEVRMEDEARKINPNFAPPAVMAALLRTIGLDPARATSLAAAIADWRTRSVEPLPGGAKAAQYRAAGLPYGPALRPFENLDELGLVLGMRPTSSPASSRCCRSTATTASGARRPIRLASRHPKTPAPAGTSRRRTRPIART